MCLYFSIEGQSLVELAIFLPVFVILLLALFLLGQYFNMQISLDMAVAAALRADTLGYNGRQVFFNEWENLTGKDSTSVMFRLTKYVHVITAAASTEIEMPDIYKNFNLPNPKIHSKLTQIKSLTRL